MVKNKKGFSLTEALILLVILAIAIAASTPMITRKIINTTEAGTTLSGGTHGRYEIFTKEIVTFDGKSYEKTTDPDPDSPGSLSAGSGGIVVFRRLLDDEYIQVVRDKGHKATAGVTNDIPDLDKATGYKETLYEEINDAKVHRDPNGQIKYVEFKDKSGSMKKHPIGGNIIVESADTIYVRGCLNDSSTPKTFTQRGQAGCLGGREIIPNDNNRIIEGNLTDYYNNHPQTRNKLWHLGTDPKDNQGEVDDIPWERLISGDNVIIDRPIPPTPGPGGKPEYIGTFNPGENAQNLTLHAVGGGGAGGGINNAGKAITPANATTEQLELMKKDLAKRFKDVTGATITVGETWDSNYHNKKLGDSDPYIVLNRSNGTITVKVDVRIGKHRIFPHQLLDYTKILGAQTQDSLIYDMPFWGDFGTIHDRGFYAAIIGCATDGGASDGYTTEINDDTVGFWNWGCARDKYCPSVSGTDQNYQDCGSYTTCPSTSTNCTPQWVSDWKYLDKYCDFSACDPTYYTNIPSSGTYSGSCSGQGKCPNAGITWNGTTCQNTYKQGAGGKAGKCAVACALVKENAPISLSKDCWGRGDGGSMKSFPYAQTFVLHSGEQGTSCLMTANSTNAFSEGGYGGNPVSQNKFTGKMGNVSGLPAKTQHDNAKSKAETNPESLTENDKNILSTYRVVFEIDNTYNWLCYDNSGICASGSGTPGANGRSDTTEFCPPLKNGDANTGIAYSPDGIISNDIYNHIYSWTMPYAVNSLAFGEAGNAGEYKATKISRAEGEIRIKLGEGGVWTNRDLAINGNASHQAMPGPDGTDTVITMNNKTILVAKGGKGGKQALKTHRYDLCYAKAGICKKGSLEINCCEKEQGTRSTRDILATTGQMSPFENIKAIVGKSLVVGTGLGRGGDGTGSRAGFEENYGFRAFVNASGHNVTYPVASVHYPNHDNEINNTPPAGFNKDTDYDNKPLPPSELNFKGGGGGVIITW